MIVVVNFSSRKDGNCYQISGVVKKHYKEKKVKIFNFYENTYYSCGHCDYECFKKKCKIGDGINEIFKAIVQSEETVFVVPKSIPKYVSLVPPVLTIYSPLIFTYGFKISLSL